jgi:hypothetical protein
MASTTPGLGPLESHLSLMLGSGGDERILPDPATGRNRYGTTLAPAPSEIWFSSSTASTISERGYGEALRIFDTLLAQGTKSRLQLHDWLGQLRSELLAYCGRETAQVVLAASGTDAELIALSIADRLLSRPVTNIVVAPNETGSGVVRAASGKHFLSTSSLGGPVPTGERLSGWAYADIEVRSVDIRTPEGEPRDPAAVDVEVANHAERALARGRGVLLHVLDTSKTGLSGLTRDVAARIVTMAPERVHVMVDACQLRCPADRLRSDLDQGFMVLVTGSKFMAGPPLSGALLLPESIAMRLREAPLPPQGLADYSARLDWPEPLQSTFAKDLTTTANLGAGLRWTAALSELRRFAAVDQGVKDMFCAAFAGEVRQRADEVHGVTPLSGTSHGIAANRSIVPLAIRRSDGRWASCLEAAKLQAGLRTPTPGHGRVIHVGQPVQLGERAVLRVCASAPQVSAVAARMSEGASFEGAFAAVSRDLQALFAKLGDLLDGDAA